MKLRESRHVHRCLADAQVLEVGRLLTGDRHIVLRVLQRRRKGAETRGQIGVMPLLG